MKFGFRTAGFKGWDIKAILLKLSELGYDGVELCLEHPELSLKKLNHKTIHGLKEYLTKLGLEAASVSYHGDIDPLPIKLANTFEAIKIAGLFSPRLLIFNCEKVIPGEKKKQFKDLINRINRLLKVAKDQDITLAIEPEPGLIISDVNDVSLLLEEISSPYLAVNLDIGHSYITDENVTETIQILKDRIAHVHLEDIKDKIHKHLLPAEGDINFEELFSTFQKINYKGYFVVDLFDAKYDPAIVAEKSLRKLKEFSDIGGKNDAKAYPG